MTVLSDVIDRLVVVFAGAVTVPVVDGPVATSVNQGRFVSVGAGAEGEGGATTIDPSDLGPGTWLQEIGEVACSAWSWSGGTDLALHRRQSLELAEQCTNAVRGDRTLAGLLVEPTAHASGLTYRAEQTSTGPIAVVSFTVAYQALVTS